MACACTSDSSACRAWRDRLKFMPSSVSVAILPAVSLMRATSRPSSSNSAVPCQPLILPLVL